MKHLTAMAAALLLATTAHVTVQADPVTVQARLVLGTSKEQKDQMEVSAGIKGKLARVFKWKHYYELNSEQMNIADAATKSAKLSRAAQIKVTNKKNNKVAVALFCKGKMLVQKNQNLKPGSHMVLAGNSASGSAWFI
ncbi:MAG: hypothetical protein QGF56_08940, partial [Verrucomicrobiota bacterium]|nr:hypothetical protein [Verrucomicrobiota bacterium]